MNSSIKSTGNASIDDSLMSVAHQKLVESGERERLINLLTQRLNDSGWKQQLKGYCQKIVKEKGVHNVTLDDLVTQVLPIARNNVPNDVREEIISQIRVFLSKELQANSPTNK